MTGSSPPSRIFGKKKLTQWWLASLDRYGNPTLKDGPHSNKRGVLESLKIYRKLWSGKNYFNQKIGQENPCGYAIARITLEVI